MGQSKWAGVCALFIACLLAVRLSADDEAENPFGAEHSPGAEVGHNPVLAERRIEFILDQPLHMQMQFPETPLNTIMGMIADEYEIPILFDTAALDAIAVSPDQEVSIDLANVSLRSALDLMLKQVEDVTYIVDNEVLLITTEDEANKLLETRVYRVDNLCEFAKVETPQGGASARADYNSLIHVVTTCIEPNSWKEKGGEGTISLLPPGMLVIRQTAPIHAKVGKMLDELGRVKREINQSKSHDAGQDQTALAP